MSITNILLKKIEMVSHIFYGIHDDKLFVQIATADNEVVYEAETTMKDPSPINLMDSLSILFPDSFKETGIKVSRITFFEWDGQKIIQSGEKRILDCKTVKDIFPKFGIYLFSCIYDNGKF